MSANSEQKITKQEAKTVNDILKQQKKAPMIKAQSTGVIKLKDNLGHGGVRIPLVDTFGFMPKDIVIQKVAGRNNAIIVSAIVPEEVLLQEAERERLRAERAKRKAGGQHDDSQKS